ncbi:histidine kinase [Aureisphaera galaxeae]|uniref:histidine kinase n=1 Tax=Aureisphaera galaxeae TaxID=1538023 RepID=UPI0023501373|nr:histidine kinase [Aureisphaera galaxeae]MDC8003039.1 histidine kinase [Aureisphaera galaxeae]
MPKFCFLIVISLLLFQGCERGYKRNTADPKRIVYLTKELVNNTHDSIHDFAMELNGIMEANRANISDSLKAEINFTTGVYHRNHVSIDSSSIYFQRAMEYVKDTDMSARELSYFYWAWITYFRQEKFGDSKAVRNRYRTLLRTPISNEKDRTNWSIYYYYLENEFFETEQYDSAFYYNRLKMDLVRASKDTINNASGFIREAEIYYHHFKNPKKAFSTLSYLMKRDTLLLPGYNRQLYNTYGIFLFHEGDYRRSFDFYLKGLSFVKQMDESPAKMAHLANNYCNLGEVCIKLGYFDKAEKYLDSVRDIGLDKIDEDIHRNYLEYKFRLSHATGASVEDIVTDLNSIRQVQADRYIEKSKKELVALSRSKEYERVLATEKKETEVKNLRLQIGFMFAIMGSAILGGIGFLFYRQRKLKFEQQSLQMQQRLLRSQMNPHFTFNTLYAIQAQIKKEPEAATHYLLKFSRLLRLFLENSMGDYIPLHQEIESLKKYMDLRKLGNPNLFTYKFQYENMEEDEPISIPPMLLQPFIENSIDHGFLGIHSQGKIDIRLSMEKEFLHCEIEDNGRGISDRKPTKKKSASVQLIANFIKKTTKRELEIINKKDQNPNENGLLVRFRVPISHP